VLNKKGMIKVRKRIGIVRKRLVLKNDVP